MTEDSGYPITITLDNNELDLTSQGSFSVRLAYVSMNSSYAFPIQKRGVFEHNNNRRARKLRQHLQIHVN